jgi:hypothetical protein
MILPLVDTNLTRGVGKGLSSGGRNLAVDNDTELSVKDSNKRQSIVDVSPGAT